MEAGGSKRTENEVGVNSVRCKLPAVSRAAEGEV